MTSTVASAWSDTVFPSMGSTARILLLGGPPDLPDLARERLGALEALWSRFEPTSELCRLNAADGAPVMVSSETYDVIALAVSCWRTTGGRFDPTVIDALERAGYDRDFGQIKHEVTSPPNAPTVPTRPIELGPGARPDGAPGCADIQLAPLLPAVRLPVGVRLDLGGIGKGRAADLLTLELLAAGADGVCVNLGGDVRVSGTPPTRAGWQIDLDDTLASSRSFLLGEGAVATSTRLKRAWVQEGEAQHHLVDPRSGRPAWSGLSTVTVLAPDAATAEVLAKAAFVAGPAAGAALLSDHQVTGLFVHDDGRVDELAGLEVFLA
jgi:FAD:protein FMN transferase